MALVLSDFIAPPGTRTVFVGRIQAETEGSTRYRYDGPGNSENRGELLDGDTDLTSNLAIEWLRADVSRTILNRRTTSASFDAVLESGGSLHGATLYVQDENGVSSVLIADIDAADIGGGFFNIRTSVPGGQALEARLFSLDTDDQFLLAMTLPDVGVEALSLSAEAGSPTASFALQAVASTTVEHLAVSARAGDPTAAFALAAVAPSPLNRRDWQMARAISNAAVDVALDEWGIWSEVLDVAALYARQTHHRAFGGYVYGVVDATDLGPADQHVLSLSLAGYGLRLDHSYVRQIYASPSGSTIREIVQDVLDRAGLDDVFSSHGVELDDTITRAVYPVESVMTILRSLADLHGAIVTVDEWLEIDLVRRTNLESSPLVLSGGRTGNCRSIGRSTEPRYFANRAVVVGRGERGVVDDVRTGDGVTTRFDASQPIGDILSITEDGNEERFDGTDPRWEIDVDQQRFVLAPGKGATPDGETIRFSYVSAEAMVVTRDNAAAIFDIGFPITRRYEDDTIDDVSLARTLADARLDRHDQRFEEFITTTIPGAVKRLRPGVAPTWNFPRQGLSSVRLLVESVSERLGAGGGAFHPVVLTIRGTAQDYQGDAGDDWRATTAYRPPAPRPADPDQEILRPGNVAVASSVPLQLGGDLGYAITSGVWGTPDGAILTRVSGHQIGVPLALSFMARCRPRGGLITGQAVEVRLWDATTNQAIGSSVSINTTAQGGSRGVLRAISLPLRDFDLTYQARVLGNLRAATVWGVALKLDM